MTYVRFFDSWYGVKLFQVILTEFILVKFRSNVFLALLCIHLVSYKRSFCDLMLHHFFSLNVCLYTFCNRISVSAQILRNNISINSSRWHGSSIFFLFVMYYFICWLLSILWCFLLKNFCHAEVLKCRYFYRSE